MCLLKQRHTRKMKIESFNTFGLGVFLISGFLISLVVSSSSLLLVYWSEHYKILTGVILNLSSFETRLITNSKSVIHVYPVFFLVSPYIMPSVVWVYSARGIQVEHHTWIHNRRVHHGSSIPSALQVQDIL